MYKRTEKSIKDNPPALMCGQKCMCKSQFGKAKYTFDIAFCISTRIDASGAYCIIVRE